MLHKVGCAVCGRKGKVEIDNKTRKILNKDWGYWGKIDVNYKKTTKYFYVYPKGKPFKLEKGVKTKNQSYDKNAKPRLVEHWECFKCMKD